MTPDHLPPPGPERDAEILLLLGETSRPGERPSLTLERSADGEVRVVDLPAFSTDPAACDRLVEEMVRRGWIIGENATGDQGEVVRFAEMHRGEVGGRSCGCRASTRGEAVSGAALLALRGERG